MGGEDQRLEQNKIFFEKLPLCCYVISEAHWYNIHTLNFNFYGEISSHINRIPYKCSNKSRLIPAKCQRVTKNLSNTKKPQTFTEQASLK